MDISVEVEEECKEVEDEQEEDCWAKEGRKQLTTGSRIARIETTADFMNTQCLSQARQRVRREEF